MSYSNLFQILYMGRKVHIFDQLQAIFAEQNQIADQRLLTNLRNGTRSPQTNRGGGLPVWPTVEFVMATNQKAAMRLISAQPPTLVLVELDQKSDSRLRFCNVVRYRLPTAIILAVAAEAPAGTFAFDDVIHLPLTSTQVIDVIQRFGAARNEHVLQLGPISLNMATRTVVTPNGRYAMTPKQCALLKLLMSEHGNVVDRKKIMAMVWETNYLDDTRTLDVHIRWLRERIEHNPSKPVYLQTIRGVGYRFEVKDVKKR